MKKIWISVLPVLALLSCLTGCGNDEPEKVNFDKNVVLAESYVEMDTGDNKSVAIVEGNGGYAAKSVNTDIATAAIENGAVKITGVASGKTSVIVSDANGIKSIVSVLVYFEQVVLDETEFDELYYGDESIMLDAVPVNITVTEGNGGYRFEYSEPNLEVGLDGEVITVTAKGPIDNEVEVTVYDRTGKSTSFTVKSAVHPILDNDELRLEFQGRVKLNSQATTTFTFYNRLVDTDTKREFGWREDHNYKTFYLRMTENDFAVGDKSNVVVKFDFDNYGDGGGYLSSFTAVDWAKVIKNDGEKFWMAFRFANRDKGNLGVIVQNIAAD